MRPRSATEIADASFQILRAHYAPFVTCSAIAYVPFLIVRLVVLGDPARWLARADEAAAMPAGAAIGLLASWLTFTVMSSVLLVCASDAYLNGEVDVGAAVRVALPRIPAVVVAAIIRYLAMLVAFLLFFFPILYVVARYFAVTPAIVLERAGVARAFTRSAELSRGRKWHILNTLGLVAIICWVILIGVSVVAQMTTGFVTYTVLSSITTVLLFPVVAIAEALLYYDARIQSEGLDIELMTDALTATGAPVSPAR